MNQDIFVQHFFLFLTPLMIIQHYLTYKVAQDYFNLKDKKLNYGKSNILSPRIKLDVSSLSAIRKRILMTGTGLLIAFFIIGYLPQILGIQEEAVFGIKLGFGAFGSWFVTSIYSLLINRFQLKHLKNSDNVKGEVTFSPEYIVKLKRYENNLLAFFVFVMMLFIHSLYLVGAFLMFLVLGFRIKPVKKISRLE